MVGTVMGGKKAAIACRERYGNDFYSRLGKKGGQNGHIGGFTANPELARIAGAKGGRKSRRGKARDKKEEAWERLRKNGFRFEGFRYELYRGEFLCIDAHYDKYEGVEKDLQALFGGEL